MRIIAGKLRGKVLKSPKDEKVRPTLDRVKEAVFSMIMPYLRDAEILDLFAGSGALGLESLSRGARFTTFVDVNKDSIMLVKDNVKVCNMEERSRVLLLEAKDALREAVSKNWKFDIIFMDPPYEGGIAKKVLQEFDFNIIMNEKGIVIVETDIKELTDSEIGNLMKTREKTYGQTRISIYERK
ncbi:MAG: 16S rRNA (guanine(966)-N(2))-methyltransferase RsmD [Filifactoraceae bacterium]